MTCTRFIARKYTPYNLRCRQAILFMFLVMYLIEQAHFAVPTMNGIKNDTVEKSFIWKTKDISVTADIGMVFDDKSIANYCTQHYSANCTTIGNYTNDVKCTINESNIIVS